MTARACPCTLSPAILGGPRRTTPLRSHVAVALMGLLGGGLLSRAGAAEPAWPRFHGAGGDNVAAESGLLPSWPQGGPKLLWTAQGIGAGYAGVTLANGMIYTAGDIGSANVITALDLAGNPRWRFENGAFWRDPTPGARGTPVVEDGLVYHENAHGVVVCLEAGSGRKLWGRDLVQEFGGRYSEWGYSESLVLDGERLICCPGGATAMVALDRRTGQTVWKAATAGEAAGYATAIVVTCQGLRLVLTMSQTSLIGVNADTGELLWKFPHFNPRYVANCVSPIYRDGQVFISGGYGTGSALLKIAVSGTKATVAPVWRSQELDNRHGGVVLLDGFLYGAAHEGRKGQWCCLEWQTGRLTYAEPGVGEGSLTAADGMLYTLSERRQVGLVRAGSSGHTVVSQFTLPAGGSGATWAHPVVCGGRLYLRHGDRLYAYDIRAQ